MPATLAVTDLSFITLIVDRSTSAPAIARLAETGIEPSHATTTHWLKLLTVCTKLN